MKKYDLLILISFFLYLFIAFITGFLVFSFREDQNRTYLVEENRLKSELETKETIDQLDLSLYPSVKEVSFLNITETDSFKVKEFFQTEKNDIATFVPWYHQNNLSGYVKLTYHQVQKTTQNLFFIIEGSLFLLEIFVLILLFNIRKKIMKPFHRLSELPNELAQGHLKHSIKLEKSKYFKQFLLGISQLKDSLEVSKKRELELIKEKKQLLLSLSHDIKTPLNLIRLYGKALEDRIYENDEQKQKAVSQISEKVIEIEKYMEEMTRSFQEDFLDLTVEKGEFYLRDLIDKISFVYQEQCQLRHIEFEILPFENRLLVGDLNRCQEILENLCENAIKYGDGRKIVISFSVEDYCLLIHVFNTGSLVLENEFHHLFDSFFRGMNAKGKPGSGLGLSICQGLMQKMGGTIYAEVKEEGMMFTLVFR